MSCSRSRGALFNKLNARVVLVLRKPLAGSPLGKSERRVLNASARSSSDDLAIASCCSGVCALGAVRKKSTMGVLGIEQA